MNSAGSPMPETEPSKRLPITSLVLGLISIPAALGIMVASGAILGLAAIIVGVVALSHTRRSAAAGSRMAVAGIVTGALGIVSTMALIASFALLPA